MGVDELSDVVKGWFDPDFTGRSPEFRVGGFAGGFHEVGDDGGAEFPLAKDSRGMISGK